MLAGTLIGAAGVSVLHAQAKPPVYLVTEIDVTNPDAYGKEFAPKAQATIKAAGGRQIAIGGAVRAQTDDCKQGRARLSAACNCSIAAGPITLPKSKV